ncbi:universal stress protein [Noviherbaspirillum agri]
MFKHLLLPTDGSAASESAVQQAVEFARATGAKITGFHAMPAFHTFTTNPDMLEDTREQFEKDREEQARKFLASIETAAREARVPCEVVHKTAEHPYEAIIDLAAERGCDLIAMASHGRRGMKGLLMGSETQKVLTHSTIPVLVYR